MDETKPTIVFDPKANACPFYVRYEEAGRVRFFDLEGAKTLPKAKKLAKAAGFEDCGFRSVQSA